MEKKRKKAKWLSGEALQIAEKREVKGKGEKERYLLEFRVPKNSKEKIRKPSSGINTKK